MVFFLILRFFYFWIFMGIISSDFFGFFQKLSLLLLKVTKELLNTKNLGRSPPQKLEVFLRSGLYLLVIMKGQVDQINFIYFIKCLNSCTQSLYVLRWWGVKTSARILSSKRSLTTTITKKEVLHCKKIWRNFLMIFKFDFLQRNF